MVMMLMSMLILSITSIALNMFLMINPLSMGMSILFTALILASLFSYSMSSWIAFLIFLIYIGGMLVMFSYFVSLIPNQTINLSSILFKIFMTFLMLLMMSFTLKMYPPILVNFTTQTNMFYMSFNMPTLLTLASILLLTMIIVVKLTTSTKGPLRPFN